uniref:Uncharacterized protein n=1 Tax=Hyaloperonospora arabidopsidis (strain Emoy2) TaxID=559515 RepID=M4B556_HYAAE
MQALADVRHNNRVLPDVPNRHLQGQPRSRISRAFLPSVGEGVNEGNVHHDGDAAAIITAGNPVISMDGDSVAGDPSISMEMAPDTIGDSGSKTGSQ